MGSTVVIFGKSEVVFKGRRHVVAAFLECGGIGIENSVFANPVADESDRLFLLLHNDGDFGTASDDDFASLERGFCAAMLVNRDKDMAEEGFGVRLSVVCVD